MSNHAHANSASCAVDVLSEATNPGNAIAIDVPEGTMIAWGQKTQPSHKHREYGAFNRLPSVNLGRTDARNCVDNVSAIVLTRTTTSLDRSQDRPRSFTFRPTPMIVLDLPNPETPMKFVLQPWQLMLIILAGWINRQQQEVIEYLRTENAVLKEKLGKKRILLTDDQRRRLAVKGKLLGRKQLEQVGTLFTPDTILQWHRQLVANKWDYADRKEKKSGRPRISPSDR